MIITKLKELNQILEYLQQAKSVFIVGCNSCAAQCQTGGDEDVKEMAEYLQKAKKKVTGTAVPDETCHIPLVKKSLSECKKQIQESDAILVMSCGAGTQAVSSLVESPVFPACDTLFLGDVKRLGDFTEFCSLCGDCVLGETGGICPVTRCPKGILNGPCGGMHQGKCEIDEETECVWVQIWERLQKLGCVHLMMKRRPPKDYSKKKKPGTMKVKRRAQRHKGTKAQRHKVRRIGVLDDN